MGPLCCDQPETLTQCYYPRVDSMAINAATCRREQLLRYEKKLTVTSFFVLLKVAYEASANDSLLLYFQQAFS